MLSETKHYREGMGKYLTTYSIGQMPEVTCPDLLDMQVMAELTADRFNRSTKAFSLGKLFAGKWCRLSIFGWHRQLKRLVSKKFLSQRLRQIGPICQQHSAVSFGQLGQHLNIVDVGRCHLECLNHPQRVDLGVQSKTVESLISKLFAVGRDPLEELAEPCSGESAGRYWKAVNDRNSIFEFPGDAFEKALFDEPEVCSLADEGDSTGQTGEVVTVEISEKAKDISIGIEAEDFADDFHGKHFTVCHLRGWPSRSKRPCWEEFVHKIISFAEDIYDKIIKVHFLALHDQWNNLLFLTCIFHRPEGLFNINTQLKTCTQR